jgi:hypothetical protein
MISNAGPELAANRRSISGVPRQVCALRANRRQIPRILHLFPQQHREYRRETPRLQADKARFRYRPDTFTRSADHSTPIGRSIVERFSPTRL